MQKLQCIINATDPEQETPNVMGSKENLGETNMKVYVRNDLKMRKGKIAAQVSHAVVGLFLNAMKKTENKYILEGENFRKMYDWFTKDMPIEIVVTNSEEEIMDLFNNSFLPKTLIQDQGRTEFNGVPTITCFAEFQNDLINESDIDCEAKQYEPVQAKQVIVVNNDIKDDKWTLAPKAARASLKALLATAQYTYIEDESFVICLENSNDSVKSWLNGAFAKITAKTDSAYFEELQEKEHVYGHCDNCLCFGPYFNDKFEGLTSDLKLL